MIDALVKCDSRWCVSTEVSPSTWSHVLAWCDQQSEYLGNFYLGKSVETKTDWIGGMSLVPSGMWLELTMA